LFSFPTAHTTVMGILNVTPDSFSDGGQFLDPADAVRRALTVENEGAHIVDIGAQSTRPGATPLAPEEEWARLSPVLDALKGTLTIPISVDTFEPLVAKNALANGAVILNDVSGSLTNDFPAIAAAHGAGLVMMARDAANPLDVRRYFETALTVADKAGLPMESLCLDIGIGFHQSREADYQILRALPRIIKGLPEVAVMCGASRKRLIAFAAGDCPADKRLGGTLALHTAAQLGGATVLRVHDVKEAVQAATVTDYLKGDDRYDRLEAF